MKVPTLDEVVRIIEKAKTPRQCKKAEVMYWAYIMKDLPMPWTTKGKKTK